MNSARGGTTVFLLGLCIFACAAAHAQTTTGKEEYDTPFNTVIVGSCITESVALTSIVHTSVKRTESNGTIRIEV